MKILNVYPKYRHHNWQKNPNRKILSYDNLVLHGSAVEKYGAKHQVIPFWWDVAMIERGRKAMNRELLEFVSKEKPDVIFFRLAEREIYKKTFIELTKRATTIYWCSDDSWLFDSVSKKVAPLCTWVASWPSSVIEKYKKMGCKTIFTIEGIRETLYRPVDPKEKDIDVSFGGTYNPQRGRTIQGLRDAGIPVMVFGKGWPEGERSIEDTAKIMAKSKICLVLNPPSFSIGLKPIVRLFMKRPNFGSPWRWLGMRPDFWNLSDNIKEWLGKRTLQVKTRTFETLACRTLGMTLYAEDLGKYYDIGKEIVVYKDIPDLAEKIRYYLAHDEEREAIADAGYRRTIKDHTISKRLENIFKTIGIEA